MDGIINLLKPSGMTSQDAVTLVKKKLGVKKAGHAGTLDPNSAGVLIVLVGKATRMSDFLMDKDKSYRCFMRLGISTDTLDSYGKIMQKNISKIKPERERIESVLNRFTGSLRQIPPMYSAIKLKGKKLYQYALKNLEIKNLPPREIKIYKIDLLSYEYPEIAFDVYCSKGTYIRSLVRDIAKELGDIAYMNLLIRTSAGIFGIADAVLIDEVASDKILKMEQINLGFEKIMLTNEQIADFKQGKKIYFDEKKIDGEASQNKFYYISDEYGAPFSIGYLKDGVLKNKLYL